MSRLSVIGSCSWAVPTWTATAPASRKARTSAGVVIPPQPITDYDQRDAVARFARAYAAAAHSEEALDHVAGLLDGSQSHDGLTVDTDLRWLLLTALAREGRADEARIAEELERDNTISGQESAATARTVRPEAEAKATAWQLAVESTDTPNETQRSIALAFPVPGQGEVLAPYLEKYLTAAETVWERLGTQRASMVLEYMFPMPLASEGTVRRVDAWLESTEANPAAQRYVREGRADMVRALAAQARDAAR